VGEGDKHGIDDGQHSGADSDGNALMSHLGEEVAYLRDENRRKDQIIMQQAITLRQLAAAPQEPSEDAEMVEETPPQFAHPTTNDTNRLKCRMRGPIGPKRPDKRRLKARAC
jgi:hypothetical protein